MTGRPHRDLHTPSRAKLPADSIEALRELTHILGGSRASIEAFFGQAMPRQKPAALSRDVRSREAKLRKARGSF